ncbi:NAD(P)H-dependent oxidoreductase [Phycisphaerae bacterium]|jgi:nitroreductase|nr:NAD(P)H-dependent oxidoreductase [Phycisphaerae bacterium]
MQTVAPEVLLQQLNWRYAVKKFDASKKIAPGTWSALEKSLVLSPSSYGLQPWRFVIVTDSKVRQQLRPVSWNQPQITDASHLVVFLRKEKVTAADVDKYIDRIVEVRKVPREVMKDYRNMMVGTAENPATDHMVWNSRQVYIALGFFLSAAAMLGIDACPMEGIDAAKYDEVLNLKGSGYTTTVVATAGYRADDDMFAKMAKVRFPDNDMIVRV